MPKLLIQPYKRISVIGISGSGKSTFARKLGLKTGLPVYHMDSLYWGPGWQEIPEEIWTAKEQDILAEKEWILEGYLDEKHSDRLSKAELLLYLDLSGWRCALNGLKRWVSHRHKPRPELPATCLERFDLSFLWAIFTRKERAEIERAIKHIGPTKLIRLNNQSDINAFCEQL